MRIPEDIVAQTRVVILSSRSIFAEGVAARLRHHLNTDEIRVVDAQQPDAMQSLIALQPTQVILEAADETVARHCPLESLLSALPDLRVIRLDPQQEYIQVVTSQQRTIGQISDLMDVIQTQAK